MRADGTAPGRPAPGGPDPGDVLRGCARDVLEIAEGIRAVSERTATTLSAPDLTAATRRHPRTGPAGYWALLRALTARPGLAGTEPRGGLTRARHLAGRTRGTANLAALVALTSLRLRVTAVLTDHPELARTPGMRLLDRALTAGRDEDAVRALRALLRDRTAQRALSGLAPLISELLAVRALLDGQPEGGGTPEGGAEPVDLTDQRRRIMATEGSLLGFLRNIEALSTDGRILVQNVRGPDGVVRYVVQAPGTAPGRPRADAPQDLVGAWRDLCATDSPYTRSLAHALAVHGIPRGAELALIGHGEGGNAVLNLAQDEDFCRTYRVTHAIAVGSPSGDRKPADPRTWIATVTNQYDLVAAPDGHRTDPAAPPADPADTTRYRLEYAGPTREFPLCHRLREYIEHLRTLLPAARADLDEALAPYRGPVVRTQAYRLTDHAHPPAGHPFLTLATAPVRTTVGPVDVPVRYYDSAAAHLCFPVDPAAARSLLPDADWLTPSRLGPRALAVLSVHEHRCTTIGPYTEIALSVLVDDLWRPRRYDAVTDLLRRVDLRRTGRYVLSLAVTTEAARVVAQEVWGQPVLRMRAEADLTGREIRARSEDLGLVVEGRLGPGVRCPDADRALYGRRGTGTVRTLVRAHGWLRLHPGAGVRVRLDTAAAEPLAGQLRRLGIDAARPLFVLACPQFMAHRGGGAELAR
ncbi:acetoacetate decarboxylase family protein [Streptomyces sp. WP-1]|uniref:acetoacetate decarboxylase family protein n=1 Tax=Streptomyces sp. WP-1 TaxID=3041497 RepID=UPI00264813C0|nr:acetoacetate decarboxylase family protein [Streptomyces sp. WP-1]WKE73388.1 acetoacetate decarboxylase family protein [Streptomyces sp. WP-1]